jgi:hypothetical protein
MTTKIPANPLAARIRIRFLNAAGEPFESEYQLDWGPEDADMSQDSPDLVSSSSGELVDGLLDVVVNGTYRSGRLYFGKSLGADYKTAALSMMPVILKRPTLFTEFPYRLSNLGFMGLDPTAIIVLDAVMSDATMRFQSLNDLQTEGRCTGLQDGPTTDRLVEVHDKLGTFFK